MAAQLDLRPLQEGEHVGTELVTGPRAKKPLHLDIPLFVSNMSYGALSEEAKVSLSTGAELAGTGICSGEGGMLPEDQAANSRYFYEYASGKFAFEEKKLTLSRRCTSSVGRAPRPAPAATCPAARSSERLPRSAA